MVYGPSWIDKPNSICGGGGTKKKLPILNSIEKQTLQLKNLKPMYETSA